MEWLPEGVGEATERTAKYDKTRVKTTGTSVSEMRERRRAPLR
jgi:hypothetical protein